MELVLSVARGRIDSCGATGLFLEMHAIMHSLRLTSIELCAFKLGAHGPKKNSLPCFVSCFSRQGLVEGHERDIESWDLAAREQVSLNTTSRLEFRQPLFIPKGATYALLLSAEGCDTYIACNKNGVEQTSNDELSVRCVCTCAGRVGQSKLGAWRAPVASMEYFPQWKLDRVMWIGWHDHHHCLSQLSTHIIQYILHLSKLSDFCIHDVSTCPVCSPGVEWRYLKVCNRNGSCDDGIPEVMQIPKSLQSLWPFLSPAEKEAHWRRQEQREATGSMRPYVHFPPTWHLGSALREMGYRTALGRVES